MNLLVGLYLDASPARLHEFLTCIERNAANRYIDAVHVFIEDAVDPASLLSRYSQLASPKIRLIAHGRRLTFLELFTYANRELQGRRVAIANADIFFDDTLARLDYYDLGGRLLCLSRWDLHGDGSWRLFEFESSQDAWIFETPVPPVDCDFHLGLLGCDNRLAWEADRAGLLLSNPSRSVRANHLHASGVRRYTAAQRLHGSTLGVPPVYLAAAGLTPVAGGDASDARTGPIFALTSLSPSEHSVEAQQRAIATWREAGLEVRSFNHPSELATLGALYDVELVPVEQTAFPLFGRHLVPIDRMLDWAAERDAAVLIVNSDIELRLARWELQRARRVAEGGLCYFIRHNHDGDLERATPEPFGIDAFLFAARDTGALPESFLCLGQPFWDYWLPYTFAAAGRPLVRVDFPATFHRRHPQQWSWEGWQRCGIELGRVTRQLGADQTMEACFAMEARVREMIDRARTILSPTPFAIRDWVEKRFRHAGAKTFLELGAHCGTDSAWMSQIPGVTLHAFEPDPRNEQPPRPNVTLHRAAVGEADGRAGFVLSKSGWGQVWTHSSSLKRPKHHLTRYPVTFGETIEVETIALDTFAARAGIDIVDFIWADIQGAEGEMIRGGLELLRRTRYLFTEYSDEELYEGQSTLADILALLPDYRVVELWPEDVLLENRAFAESAHANGAAA